MVRTCVAAGCNNTGRDGISFFKFPSDVRRRQEWTRQVQRTRDNWSGPTKYSFLCATHFISDCFEPNFAIAASMGLTVRRQLKPDAIPTVFERRISNNSRSGACGSGPATSSLRKRDLPTLEATNTVSEPKRPRQACLKKAPHTHSIYRTHYVVDMRGQTKLQL